MTPKFGGALLIAGFAAMEVFFRRGATAKSVRPKATDGGTSSLIIVAYALAVLAIASHVLPSLELPAWLAWVGVAIGALGLALRIWAMRVLGRFYTRTLVTTTDQQVVSHGPYRFVRHPGYAGSILVWIGAAASSRNPLSIAAVAVLLAIAYAYRIRVEERMLIDALGAPYQAYRRRSWRLVPFLF